MKFWLLAFFRPYPLRRSPLTFFRPFRFLTVSVVLGAFLSLAFLPACSGGKSAPPPKAQPVPVTVAAAVKKTVPVEVKTIGNVEAYASVAVKARVGGELKQVHFREGQEGKKGD